MATAVAGVIGLLLGVASIPMIEQFYADKIDAGKVYTKMKIGAGSTLANESDYNTGGHKPNIALWGNDGHRIGRYRPHKKDDIPDGTQANIKVEHKDTEPKNAAKQPEYILVEMNDDDAVCVNYVAVTGPDNNQMGWYGDVGYSCGGDWYHSQYKIGENNYMPKCVWLDKNHSNNLRFRGMGIHMTDFNSNSQALAKQYQDYPDSMCKTAPRFKLYEEIGPDDVLPVYFPPLNIVPVDNTDVDPVAVASNQGIPGGDPGLDFPHKSRLMVRNTSSTSTTATGKNSTHTGPKTNQPGCRFDGHLIISHHEQHSATELCESDHSVGADFVSIYEKLFCDMYTKHLWPICVDTIPATNNTSVPTTTTHSNQSTHAHPHNPRSSDHAPASRACFDLTKQTMRNAGPHRRDDVNGRPIPDKSYEHAANWQ